MRDTILTLTVNPAIDRIVTVDRLVFEDRAYILSTDFAAGGRGINAARVLKSFGAKILAITTSGGEGGRRLEEKLSQDGFPVELVKIKNHIRTNVTISDRQGLSVKLNEQGPTLADSEVKRIHKAVEKHFSSATWLMLCGSAPPGVPADFYAKLIREAEKHSVLTLLDTDGEPLQPGVEAGPTVVMPNQSEAERLLGRALITRSHSIEAAQRIKAMGAKLVVLSLGSRGAIAASPDGVVEVVPPRIDAVCPIGAGDAMGAAFVWAMTHENSFEESVRWGVAAGTASTKLPGIQMATFEEVEQVFPLVQVTRI
ncbi:MAG: 1-phosphofructokinase family hexose kinase [Bryobacteraceae bacterium]